MRPDTRSFVGGERGGQLGELVLLFPTRSDGLPLGEELHACLAVEVEVSRKGFLAASEREHRQGDGNGDVNSDLAALDLILEFVGS